MLQINVLLSCFVVLCSQESKPATYHNVKSLLSERTPFFNFRATPPLRDFPKHSLQHKGGWIWHDNVPGVIS